MLDDIEKALANAAATATPDLAEVRRQIRKQEKERLRGVFTPTLATGYNRRQRQIIAAQACKEGRAELLAAGCDLLEARKEAVNPRRVSVARLISQAREKKAGC